MQGNTKGNFTLNLYSKIKGSRKNKMFPFVLFLTATQKKQLKIWPNDVAIFELTLSNNHFHKTCFATILLNRDIYHLSKYDYLPPAKNKKNYTAFSF